MPWPKGKPRPAHLRQLQSERMSQDRNPNWRGGRYQRADGYVTMTPEPGRRVLEHRLVMERALGRALTAEEVVHHINGDPSDNRIENLQLFASHAEHKSFEQKEVTRNSDGQFQRAGGSA